ncbi:hypothetical protein JAAARDRAFT_38149 [Jaapia argillacea MUCL 33604]|uniref:LIM zinc-binding domain-containing protein n=1 Tax=Jaapia argillacea MUCL 33604 TaxID=933084 RepID=A0A067PT73_9AGAM|nr:hypothetical protein JAAARDRAFT_38149 [Jaapia argillacea MUCL 33604]
MHPFGGTPLCPRCNNAVYAAEQVMGPGRKLYHKPCLTCSSCNKRLDSGSLVEHDQEPYCKNCHSKVFGTRDLRQANLPHRDEVEPSSPSRQKFSPPVSPIRTNFTGTGPHAPAARHFTGSTSINGINSPGLTRQMTGDRFGRRGAASPPPILQPTRSLSPTSSSFPSFSSRGGFGKTNIPERDQDIEEESESKDYITEETEPVIEPVPPAIPTRPLSPPFSGRSQSRPPAQPSFPLSATTLGRSNSMHSASMPSLVPTMTGTRYGVALGGGMPNLGSGKQWGSGTPSCPRCGKSVYFAEQVKAVGKTYHRGCLRCTECNTSLDSTRLTERDGNPYCHRCYGKLYGPAGSGYALLGKAGG